MNIRNFKFGRQIVASRSLQTTNRPRNGRGYATCLILNFRKAIHMSGMAEARFVKFCAQGDYIKYCKRDDK